MKLQDDEPVFILRAQDKNAPEDVRAWARKIIRDPAATEAQFKKACSAIEVSVLMDIWQKNNPDKVKLPD